MTIGTTFLQCERYYKKKNIIKCPNQIFIENLVKFITKVIAEGNKKILAINMNESVADT